MESVGEFEYNTKDLIGHGAFAVVYKGRYKSKPELPVAIKSITKKNLAKSQNLLGKEIKILKELSELHHENVVALLDCKETTHHVHLVMEYCNGGDLAEYLLDKGTLSENTIRLFLRQIAGAMRALNAKGIVHRDLKPQNILLCHAPRPKPAPADITLKIADFGFARFLQDGVMAATLCGSPMYMAPEVIMSLQYDAKADLWSIGTIVFQCLTGSAPFKAQTPQALKQFYEKAANLAPRIPSGTSRELHDLLSRLLKRNAKDRMDFDEFFSHPFLKRVAKLSSPMPVPSRRSVTPPDAVGGAGGGGGAVAPPAAGWGSPLSGQLPPSPQGWCGEDLGGSGATQQAAAAAAKSASSSSSPEDQDFVIVPASIGEDQPSGDAAAGAPRWSSEDSGSTPAKKMASGGAASPGSHEGSPRPSYLPVQQQPEPAAPPRQRVPSGPRTEPVPVPSQKRAFEQMQRSGGSSSGGGAAAMPSEGAASPTGVPSSPRLMQLERKDSLGSNSSDLGRRTPDFSNLSPPSVQFHIGTPPGGGRRRHLSGGTPPRIRHSIPIATSGSPLRRHMCGMAGNVNQLAMLNGNTQQHQLPPILGSPLGGGGGTTDPAAGGFNVAGLRGAALANRAMTLPEMRRDSSTGSDTVDCGIHKSGSAGGRLYDHGAFLRGANLASEQAALGSYSPPGSMGALFPGSGDWGGRLGSPGTVAPCCFPFGTSPPTGEPPNFVPPPELPQETLLDRDHNETLAKLHFIDALVGCIVELARSKAEPLAAALTESTYWRQCCSSPEEQVARALGEGHRRAEQLVLYVRAVQLLASALHLARDQTARGRLRPSSSVRQLLRAMQRTLHACMERCRRLSQQGVLQSSASATAAPPLTADRLLYNYAIDMCQTAAMGELYVHTEEHTGNFEGNAADQQGREAVAATLTECFRRYQTAQILLHSLAQQVENESDRTLLNRYKDAVEKRLYVLQSEGLVYAYDST